MALLLLAMSACLVQAARSLKRSIQMLNESGNRIEIYWVHPQTKESKLMSQAPVVPGARFPLQTYVGHEFEMRELPFEKTGECNSTEKTCRITSFVVSDNDDQGMFSSWLHLYVSLRTRVDMVIISQQS